MKAVDILNKLPYTHPFLFVDELEKIDENSVTGNYTYHPDLDFYKGHFKENPITPGVILTETMAQIGLVCLGIYLLSLEKENGNGQIWMTSANVAYLKPVYPGEKVTVTSLKKYFRFNKLQCYVEMKNNKGEIVCEGTLAGMLVENNGT
ncbi:beta-hydroxyacyl-ACP dehydratase [Pedobacter polaris]|uniref:Beta-hydroxyacyl-ACP dehydratase n=1 Tax=Pedobacter polaris TaxID=2571273 RepID=A0A4U1CJI5_9SPHI|nr:3-hydroxyacyl-ACP dehydratase FabZ family protein [Pedobacter polaris]TKC06714.1 beta-hydroxyacyl-ACP dehydratase [Pedobacter polaris]